MKVTGPIAEYFTIKAEQDEYRGKLGFNAYNSQGRNVAIVYACDDPRQPAFRCCQLCVFSTWQTKYGQWRIIRSNGKYIPFIELRKILSEQKEITIYVD